MEPFMELSSTEDDLPATEEVEMLARTARSWRGEDSVSAWVGILGALE
jgi:hypothetical protein